MSDSPEPQPGRPPERRVLRFDAFRQLVRRDARELPVILQLTPTDCGAACLAMTLEHYGKKLPIEDVRTAVGATQSGVTARKIVEGARRFGLRARAAKVPPEKLSFVPAGTILHWEMNHFVVLESAGRDSIRIVDPAVGHRRIPMEDVARMFTGVALLLDPSPRFVAEDKRPKTRTARYLRWIFGTRGYWPRIIVASLFLQTIALAMPAVMGVTVDKIVPQQNYHLLSLVGAGLLMVVSLHFLATFVRSHLLLHLRTYIDLEMTLEFLEHLLDLPYAFYQQRSVGDIVMRLTSGSQIRELLTSGAMAAILDGTLVVLYFGLLMAAAPTLGLIALGIAVVQAFLFWRAGKRNAELQAELLATQAKLSGYQVEMLAGMEAVKSMGAEQRMASRWSELFVDTLNISLERGRLMASFGTVVGAISFIGPISLVLTGAHMVLDGELTLGTMLALSSLGAGFLGPVNALVTTAMQLQLLKGYMARIEDVLDSPSERNFAAQGHGRSITGTIELDRVSFRYETDGRLTLQDVSVQVRPGEFLAIVGASGSGKSTLARLLAGLYRPLSGSISYDGVPVQAWDPPELRRQLGMVTQDTRLFAATIRDNIAMLDPEVPLDRVEEAAQKAHIHADIATLKMGYDTMLADGGASLSGGQRQRLALARALVSDPPVVVLDEATSALDSITEKKIQQELATMERTRIVIAHRMSTIMSADRILVLDGGRVAGLGTHAALLQDCEIYRRLVGAQSEAEPAR